jgi:hypothetical protein
MIRVPNLSPKDIPPLGGPLRGSRLFIHFSLLTSFYLVVALSVPGAFLIAKQTSVLSSSQVDLTAQYSSEQLLGGKAGQEDGGEDSWPGPKRLRGVLLSKAGKVVGIDEIVSYLITPVGGGPRAEFEELEGALRKPVLADEMRLPKDDPLPQELLGRSPPSS